MLRKKSALYLTQMRIKIQSVGVTNMFIKVFKNILLMYIKFWIKTVCSFKWIHVFIQMSHKASVYLVGHFEGQQLKSIGEQTAQFTDKKKKRSIKEETSLKERENIRVRPVPPLPSTQSSSPLSNSQTLWGEFRVIKCFNTSSVLLYNFCLKLWRSLSLLMSLKYFFMCNLSL